MKCKIRVGGYDKQMKLRARACGKPAMYIAGGHLICEEHGKRLITDNVNYTVQPGGQLLRSGTKLQKIAA